jgi:hypothetical protein
MKYRKKPVVVEAAQWFKNGDHPEDEIRLLDASHGGQSKTIETEGKVVRYFRHPMLSGENTCNHCGAVMRVHGWIDTLEGGHIVCPGDWIITGVKGEHYPCKPDIFEATYEKVES